jgi:hypothetical protein
MFPCLDTFCRWKYLPGSVQIHMPEYLQCATNSPVTCLSSYYSTVIASVILVEADSSEGLVQYPPLKLVSYITSNTTVNTAQLIHAAPIWSYVPI